MRANYNLTTLVLNVGYYFRYNYATQVVTFNGSITLTISKKCDPALTVVGVRTAIIIYLLLRTMKSPAIMEMSSRVDCVNLHLV